jgi:hypothetical protein
VADVIARAEVVDVGGQSVRAPSAADTLLLLALHATKHGWSQAEEVLSFTRIAEREPHALAAACTRAADAGIPVPMRLAIRLAADVAGVRLPVDAAWEGDDVTRALAAECVARMADGDGAWRQTHRWSLAWITGWRDRARYSARALLSPTLQEWRWLRLPDALTFAYPVVRLARLAVRGSGR